MYTRRNSKKKILRKKGLNKNEYDELCNLNDYIEWSGASPNKC